MKSISHLNCKPFAFVAALTSLLLCSCASDVLVRKEARLKDTLHHAYFAPCIFDDPEQEYHLQNKIIRAKGELGEVQRQIAQERAESTSMFLNVLASQLASVRVPQPAMAPCVAIPAPVMLVPRTTACQTMRASAGLSQ